ncbi:MAG: gamma-glutamyltransferase family protein [Beijerinckiaceae bacterium]|nr:gamma-glutamyltransferase family protein [Beijerinckiaceae bacterium]
MKETPAFAHAAVAAPHRLAAEVGQRILAAGGNAIEAMVAMAGAIAVVYPHMNSIGGDGFWLIRTPDGKVRSIEACGYAGSKATIHAYRARGYDAVPVRGPDAALTVAGAIGGWMLALELSRALGGKLPVKDLVAQAETLARDGVPVSQSEGRYIVKEREAILAVPGFAQHFLGEGGKQPEAGSLRRQPKLAGVFEQLGHAGLADFYKGDIAREMAVDLERAGAPVTRDDLARYEARWREPLKTRMPGVTLYNNPPPSQGLASLILHGVFNRLEARETESPAHWHGLIEAAKRAYAIRDRVVTDFDHLAHDPASFLTPERLAREADAVKANRAASWPFAKDDGDTIWMGAIDNSGLAVSFIQSLYWEYGSGVVLPNTGILWQNRGMAFSLDPKALNSLHPGRRPFHTLNTPLAVFEDGRVASYGAMGGDGQPQFQAQVFFRAIRYGLPVSEALDRPRFLFGRNWGGDSATLKVENRTDGYLLDRLAGMGHQIEVINKPYADMFGHAGMLIRDAKGAIMADHDPRSDGGAEGL